MLRRSGFGYFDNPNKKSPQAIAGIFYRLNAQSVSEWAGYEAIFWRVTTDEPPGLPIRSRAQANEKLNA